MQGGSMAQQRVWGVIWQSYTINPITNSILDRGETPENSAELEKPSRQHGAGEDLRQK